MMGTVVSNLGLDAIAGGDTHEKVIQQAGDFLGGTEGQPGRAEDITPQQFRQLRDPVSNALQGVLQNQQGFQGRMAAPLTGAEQQQISELQQFSPATQAREQALQSLTGEASGAAGQAENLMSQILSNQQLTPEGNPALAQAIETAQQPILEQFGDQAAQQRAEFTQAGQQIQPGASSPFQAAQADLQSGIAQALSEATTNLVQQERELQQNAMQQALTQNLQEAQTAAGIEAGINEQQLNSMMRNLEAQELPRMVEQMGLDKGLEEFHRQRNELMQALQTSGQLASPSPIQFQGTQGQPGFLQSAAPGIGEGVAAAMMTSDRRLKHKLKRVGETAAGIPLYLFEYLWDRTTQLGVLADDVEDVVPEAVSEWLGVKVVDYSKVI